MNNTTLRRNSRVIPGYSNYAVTNTGIIYNIHTGRDIAVDFNRKHWSGSVRITNDNGNRNSVARIDLMKKVYKFNDNILRRRLNC